MKQHKKDENGYHTKNRIDLDILYDYSHCLWMKVAYKGNVQETDKHE